MASAATVIDAPNPTDIIVAVEATPTIVLLDAEKFDQFYDRVRAETTGIVADTSTKKGRDEIRSLAAKVTRSKTMIDKAGLALTKQWRDQTTQVNAARKEIETKLDALADEVRRPLTDWEEAEKERVDRCNAVIAELASAGVVTLDDTTATVRERGAKVWAQQIAPEQFGDLALQAQATKDHAVETLKGALARLTREEAERAELEALRAEKEERDRIEAERRATEEAAQRAAEEAQRRQDEERLAEERRANAAKAEQERIARIAAEAEDRAKRQAEQAAQVERDRIQREHDEAIAAERRRAEEAEAAIQVERERAAKEDADRIAAEQHEAAEQAKRDKNRAHRAQIMGQAKIAILAAANEGHAVEKPITEAAAVAIVKAIVAGIIPNVTLRF